MRGINRKMIEKVGGEVIQRMYYYNYCFQRQSIDRSCKMLSTMFGQTWKIILISRYWEKATTHYCHYTIANVN